MEGIGAQNPLGFVLVQDYINVEDIADVLAKLRIVDSSLEQGSSKKEEEKKEEPYEIGGEDEPTPSLAQNA